MRFPLFLPAACLLLVGGSGSFPFSAPAWAPVGNQIKTRWAAQVDPNNPLPDYPRPQLVRPRWTNLNGLWDYALRDAAAAVPDAAAYQGQILVPFPLESSLSGVGLTLADGQALWYQRTFATPVRQPGERVLLHFGAVDWETSVFVNGQRVGRHKGGYDPFTYDVTDALTDGATQTLTLQVLDSTSGYQPRGKQTLSPGGIFYTSTTGIWQTVWLEQVPARYVAGLQIVPDVDASAVRVTVNAVRANNVPVAAGTPVQVSVLDDQGSIVATGTGTAGAELRVTVPSPRLWSPDDPYLYGLRVVCANDQVDSYFGLRKVEVRRDNHGVTRFFLNNQPLFMFGPLDQGFWPDGIYTAPTDEALRYDLEVEKSFGFNTVRKHIKVEPDRWYYWTDKLGLLVWQDFPAVTDALQPTGAPDLTRPTVEVRQIEKEMTAMVRTHANHPSIVMWVPFNEGWGQFRTAQVVKLFRRLDPTRLIDNASGWNDAGVGDVLDYHSYPAPTPVPVTRRRIAVQGEYGGGGLVVPGHLWQVANNFQYVGFDTAAELQQFFLDRLGDIRANETTLGLSGAIYTQTTDVEDEINGLMTYDRAVIKIDPAAVKAAAATLYPAQDALTVTPAADQGALVTWRYTLQSPAADWFTPGYDDSSWTQGTGGFGTIGTGPLRIGTTWNTADIWLRRTFSLDAALPQDPGLLIFHDEDAEVYLNGQLVAMLPGYVTHYTLVPLPAAAFRAGVNEFAIHVHQTNGGQGIDAGIVEVVPAGAAAGR